MSRKSWFGRKQGSKPEPRDMSAIQKEYSDLCARAGELQYRIGVMQAELGQANHRLFELNQEAHEASKKQPQQPAQDAPGTQTDSQDKGGGAQ